MDKGNRGYSKVGFGGGIHPGLKSCHQRLTELFVSRTPKLGSQNSSNSCNRGQGTRLEPDVLTTG